MEQKWPGDPILFHGTICSGTNGTNCSVFGVWRVGGLAARSARSHAPAWERISGRSSVLSIVPPAPVAFVPFFFDSFPRRSAGTNQLDLDAGSGCSFCSSARSHAPAWERISGRSSVLSIVPPAPVEFVPFFLTRSRAGVRERINSIWMPGLAARSARLLVPTLQRGNAYRDAPASCLSCRLRQSRLSRFFAQEFVCAGGFLRCGS